MRRLLVITTVFLASVASATALECVQTSKLAVDADGAPDSYRVDGRGLSHTCDGVFAVVAGVPHTQKNDKNGWFNLCEKYWARALRSGDYSQVKIVGFRVDNAGRPIVQGEGDPLPGQAFVTTTALTIPGTPSNAQRHYVDASQIPYVVLSPAYAKTHHLSLSDVVAIYRPKTGRIAYAVYGDCCSVGEASVRLHQDLGSNPIVNTNDGTRRAKQGIGDRIVMLALRGVHTNPTLDATAWRAEIASKGEAGLRALGGEAAIRACGPER